MPAYKKELFGHMPEAAGRSRAFGEARRDR